MSIAGIRGRYENGNRKMGSGGHRVRSGKGRSFRRGVVIDKIRPSKKGTTADTDVFDQYKDGDFDDILREIQRIK